MWPTFLFLCFETTTYSILVFTHNLSSISILGWKLVISPFQPILIKGLFGKFDMFQLDPFTNKLLGMSNLIKKKKCKLGVFTHSLIFFFQAHHPWSGLLITPAIDLISFHPSRCTRQALTLAEYYPYQSHLSKIKSTLQQILTSFYIMGPHLDY